MCCLNIHTDGKMYTVTDRIELEQEECTSSAKGRDFGADITPTMHHCALCNEQFIE